MCTECEATRTEACYIPAEWSYDDLDWFCNLYGFDFEWDSKNPDIMKIRWSRNNFPSYNLLRELVAYSDFKMRQPDAKVQEVEITLSEVHGYGWLGV